MNTENIFYRYNTKKTFFSNTVETVTFGDKFGYVVLITESIPAEASAPQNITYTDFNKMLSVTQGSKSHQLLYGVNSQRIKGTFKTSGITKLTRYYMGNYEEEINAAGNVRKLYYINGGNGLAAIMVRNGGVDSLYYTYCDYQGNLLTVTDAAGNVKERYAYDPWGQRVNPANWTQKDIRTSFLFSRGYTLHEHIDGFGLINMNGRMYDPLVAQFLSPDPYVQAPGNWFNYNRYAYGMNNPLLYTDPSGEVFVIDDLILAAMIGGFINTTIQLISGNVNSAGDFFGAFGIGALSGLAGGMAGQAVSSALGSATSFWGSVGHGALTGAAGGAAGGFVGGAGNAWAGGASFGDGLKQGFIGAGTGTLTSGMLGGMLGGIQYHRQNLIFRRGNDILGIDGKQAVPATDAFLKDAQKAWYPDAPMDKIRIFSVENVPASTQANMDAAGATAFLSSKGNLTGFSNVYFNKNIAFSSAKRLFFSMGHEFVHVSQYAALVGQSRVMVKDPHFVDMLDYHAYSYEYNVLGSGNYGGFTSADVAGFMNSSFSSWYQSLQYMKFSWTFNQSFRYPF